MTLERHDTVAVLRLETGKANAMNDALLAAIDAGLDALQASDAGALVVTGYDRYFSAGLDLVTLADYDRPAMAAFMAGFERVMGRLFRCERPVVAAINGHAVAGGCVLALQADWRVLADGPFKFGLNETRLGLGLPATALEAARCQVPPASLLRATLEGELFDPQTALELQLVHAVVAPDAVLGRALEKARDLASIPALAWAHVKRGLRRPALEPCEGADSASWLDTWFSPGTQATIADAVAQLTSTR